MGWVRGWIQQEANCQCAHRLPTQDKMGKTFKTYKSEDMLRRKSGSAPSKWRCLSNHHHTQRNDSRVGTEGDFPLRQSGAAAAANEVRQQLAPLMAASANANQPNQSEWMIAHMRQTQTHFEVMAALQATEAEATRNFKASTRDFNMQLLKLEQDRLAIMARSCRRKRNSKDSDDEDEWPIKCWKIITSGESNWQAVVDVVHYAASCEGPTLRPSPSKLKTRFSVECSSPLTNFAFKFTFN